MNLVEATKFYLQYCEQQKRLDQKTLKAYRIDLKQYLGFIQSENPPKTEIEQYITHMHNQYKSRTVKRKIATIKAFYNFLEEQEWIEMNPFRKIKVKFKEMSELPRVIPRGEIEQLLNFFYGNYEMTEWRLRDIAVIELFFAIGARVYEISNIKLDCIDLETGVIRILGKGGKERYIQIGTQEVLKLLQRYYVEHRESIENSGFFFVNYRGKKFSEQSMRNMIKKYAVLAGLKRNITPHMFRHSFATYLIEEGVDISCVQQMLGHSSIKTTQIYIHVAAKKQAELLRVYHPRNHMCIQGIA